eukprot:scaffold5025_cov79-Skeletonema_menzelii.AAC.2
MVSRRTRIVNELRSVHVNRATYHEAGYDVNTLDFGILEDEMVGDDEWYDVMMSRFEERNGFLPGRVHGTLTPEEKSYWNKFSPEAKELIMSAKSSSPPRVNASPRRRNGGSALRSNGSQPSSSHISNTPVAQGATANVTEQVEVNATSAATPASISSEGYDDLASIPENDPVVQANMAELFDTVYNVNVTSLTSIEDLDPHATHFIDKLEEADRQVNQTSELPPFFLPRFLSQPAKSPKPSVSFAEKPADDVVKDIKPGASATGSKDTAIAIDAKEGTPLQAASVAEHLEIHYHDATSANGEVIRLLVPSTIESPTVPRTVSYARNSVLDAWKETFPVAAANDVSDGVSDMSGEQAVRYGVRTTAMTYEAEESVTYRVSQTVGRKRKGDLADRGANGGVKGDGLRTISKIPGLHVDLSGLDNHTLSKTPIGTCGGVVVTQRGPVLLIFHRYALLNRGRTIHSPIQFEAYGNQVDDKSIEFGGTQCIKTVRGYRIPLDIQEGLAYFNTRPFTDEEFEKLPHVVMTSNEPWRPSSFNSVISDDPTWYESQPNEPLPNADNFNAHGEFLHRDSEANVTTTEPHSSPPFPFYEAPSASDLLPPDEDITPPRNINEHFGFQCMIPGLLRDIEKFGELLTGQAINGVHETTEHPRDYDALRPFLLNAPREVVMHTMRATTQWYNSIPQGSRIYDRPSGPQVSEAKQSWPGHGGALLTL